MVYNTPWGNEYNEQEIISRMRGYGIEMPDAFASILTPSEYVRCAASSVFAADPKFMTPDMLAHVIRRILPQLDINVNCGGLLTEEQKTSIKTMVIGAIETRLNTVDALIEAGDTPAASQLLDDLLCECYYGFPGRRQKGPWTCYRRSSFPPTLGTMVLGIYDNLHSHIRTRTIFEHFDANLKIVMDQLLPGLGHDGFCVQVIGPLLAS